MSTDLLRASEAARQLDMSTRDLVRLVYQSILNHFPEVLEHRLMRGPLMS